MRRRGYDGVAVCAPVSVAYRRFSIDTAHWWIGRALHALCARAGLTPAALDGLSVSSFTLAPDTAIGLTQHLGLSPRWLDHVPMGGASGGVALRRAALLTVQAAFAAGRVGKVYWAMVDGVPAATAGMADAPLLKVSTAAGWRMVISPAGQPARTAWRVLGAGGGRAWLELRPQTGRTHQVRVHCASLGCPIAGDPVYGAGGGLQLLARAITLPLDPPVHAEAPPPAHMVDGLRACGWAG